MFTAELEITMRSKPKMPMSNAGRLGISGVLCALMLCNAVWAAPGDEDSALAAQCPAAFKWRDAKRNERTSTQRVERVNAPSETELRDDLATRVAADQRARTSLNPTRPPDMISVDALRKVDAENLAWLESLVENRGFPTVDQVGKDGVADAWLLTQHADSNPAFQARVLKLLTPRLDGGGIEKKDYALLTDRVLLAQGGKQRYGSQIAVVDGAYVAKPTEDPGHLAQRRAAMDLPPMDDYLCLIRASYGPPAVSE